MWLFTNSHESCIHVNSISLTSGRRQTGLVTGKQSLNMNPARAVCPPYFCLPHSLQPSHFLNKQKTLVCFGKWTAHIPVKIHIAPCRAGEQGRKENLNSSTNAYLFQYLLPSHYTLLLLSQYGAVISLPPECTSTVTMGIFFDEKEYVVLGRGFLSSFLSFVLYNRKPLGDRIDSLSMLLQVLVSTHTCYTQTKLPELSFT